MDVRSRYNRGMRGAVVQILAAVGLGVMATGCATIHPPTGVPQAERTVLTTGYCACQQCCGWHRNWLGRPVYSAGPLRGQHKTVGSTASGSRARHGTIAADTSRYPFGTVFYVPSYGYGRVEDRGGDIKGDHIDLFFERHREALEWGRRYRQVRIWYP